MGNAFDSGSGEAPWLKHLKFGEAMAPEAAGGSRRHYLAAVDQVRAVLGSERSLGGHKWAARKNRAINLRSVSVPAKVDLGAGWHFQLAPNSAASLPHRALR
jgi:hypothetical protein